MNRKIITTGLVLLLLSGLSFFVKASAADTTAPYNAEEIYERCQNAVFYIRALHSDGSLKAAGTGVMITQGGLAATAYHVIAGAEQIEGIFNDGRTVTPIELLSYDELTDAAILQLSSPNPRSENEEPYSALPIREAPVNYGERVFAIGFPIKKTPIITEGIINSPKAEINGRDRILTSAQVVGGMSGGPIMDQHGRLTGIISGSMRTMNNIHLVIDAADIRSLLLAQ